MTVKDPIRTVIWGQPGVGKTTLAGKFPNPWFIDVEKSTKWMPELRNRQWERPKTWQEILDQIQRFKRELPGDTLVIDSIDWMEAKYIDKFGSPGGQNDYGKSYNDMDKTFRTVLDELTEISEKGVHVVLTAHFDTKEVSDPDQLTAYSKYVLKMQKKTCSAVLEWADEVLFLRFRDTIIAGDNKGKKGKAVGGQIRDIKTVRAAAYDAKNRFDLPEEIEFKSDKQLPEPLKTLLYDGYDAYLDLKNGKQSQPMAQNPYMQPVQPAPQPQPVPVQQPQPIPAVEPVQLNPPIQKPVPAPSPTPGAAPQPMPVKQIDPRVRALMDRDGITREQIEGLVKAKGWFTCPMEEYPQDFVEQMLIGQWAAMAGSLLMNDPTLPF